MDVMLNLVAGGLLADAGVDVIDLHSQSCPRLSPKAAKGPDWLVKARVIGLGKPRALHGHALGRRREPASLGGHRRFRGVRVLRGEPLAIGAFAERVAAVVRSRIARAMSRAASQGAATRSYQRLIDDRIPAGARPV